jgi:hypothetical protein
MTIFNVVIVCKCYSVIVILVIIVRVTIVLMIFLVLFAVIKYLCRRYRLLFSNAQSLDIPVHPGSIENTTKEPWTKAATVPQTGRVNLVGAINALV